jgi:hypothetical protein
MDTSTLVVGQKVRLRCGGLLGEPTEPTEATVIEIIDEYVTLELQLPHDNAFHYLVKNDNSRWAVVFKNGEHWGGIWAYVGPTSGWCEWDRRFKVVIEEAHEATH